MAFGLVIWRKRRSEPEREYEVISQYGQHADLYVLRSKRATKEFLDPLDVENTKAVDASSVSERSKTALCRRYDDCVRRSPHRVGVRLKMRRPFCGLRGHPQVIRLATFNSSDPDHCLGVTYVCHCRRRRHLEVGPGSP